jgi:hypothetical protein
MKDLYDDFRELSLDITARFHHLRQERLRLGRRPYHMSLFTSTFSTLSYAQHADSVPELVDD